MSAAGTGPLSTSTDNPIVSEQAPGSSSNMSALRIYPSITDPARGVSTQRPVCPSGTPRRCPGIVHCSLVTTAAIGGFISTAPAPSGAGFTECNGQSRPRMRGCFLLKAWAQETCPQARQDQMAWVNFVCSFRPLICSGFNLKRCMSTPGIMPLYLKHLWIPF